MIVLGSYKGYRIHQSNLYDMPFYYLPTLESTDPDKLHLEFDRFREDQVYWYINNLEVLNGHNELTGIIIVNKQGNKEYLQNHPEYDKWKDEMDIGEMFSLFGYNWF